MLNTIQVNTLNINKQKGYEKHDLARVLQKEEIIIIIVIFIIYINQFSSASPESEVLFVCNSFSN